MRSLSCILNASLSGRWPACSIAALSVLSCDALSMLCIATAAGLEQYGCVDWRMRMFQLDPTDAAGKPLRFGDQAAANFNLTAQTTNLARVTLAGIAQRVRHHSRCGEGHAYNHLLRMGWCCSKT